MNNQLKNSTRTRKMFSKIEDSILTYTINQFPDISWVEIAKFIPGRSPRQCRERWINYLSPSLNQEQWSKEEDNLLLELVKKNGKKWSLLTEYFPSRSYSNIKNRWYSTIKYLYEDEKFDKELINKNENKKWTQLSNELVNSFEIIWEKKSLNSNQDYILYTGF